MSDEKRYLSENPISFFTIIALFFGLAFLFLIPPGHVPDEPNHFRKAYHLSLGHLHPDVFDQRFSILVYG